MDPITVINKKFSAGSLRSSSNGGYDYRGILKKIVKPDVYSKIDSHWIENLGVMEK